TSTMALPVLPNSSNFLGVALVINRNRDGPRFVFHYPPHIVPVAERRSEEGADEDDILLDKVAAATDGLTPYNLNISDLISWNQDDHIITDGGTQIVPWEHVAGFPTKDLESILTPARAYHKTLFQISLDPLYFVSYPIHKPENGIWKKKKSKKKQEKSKHEDADANPRKDDEQISPNDEGEGGGGGGEANDKEEGDAAHDTTAGEETEDKISNMTMFNLVFILNPKKHEARDLIDTMYTNIIRKVNKAYKYVQQRSDFVWKESKKILLLKDKAREERRKMSQLWEEILQSSSLAASMQDLYEAISHNKIAALQLETGEGTITHSVQIPVPFHIADLPPVDREEDSRGLWITTANSFVGDHNNDALDESQYLDRNFALLLMGDDKKIISELSADPDETTLSMIEFVRHSKPIISFHQVSQQTNNILTLGQVRKYAQHFIFWRRAIAIPPLHARDVYVLSPNADMKTLPRASAAWARQFPFAPALPNFLSDLSAAPKPYKWFCPSKSFRPNYLHMLAWLMRGGWVMQLCTFTYVIVWPEIIYEVDYALEAEEVARAKKAQAAATDELAHAPGERKRRGSTNSGMAGSAPTLAEQVAEKARLERIADKAARELAEKATAHARKASPRATEHPSVNGAAHLAGLSPYIILDAKKTTGKESLYLSAIGRRLRERRTEPSDWDEKVANHWPVFWKYFNGRSALERIALQEEMKRKEVWNLLTAMSEYLLCVRHW
ncbi:hypothetical protein M406DRAFT_46827, partial [Cryphonectria parasitica EP155]